MKKKTLLILLLFVPILTWSQQTNNQQTEESPIKMKWGGFLKSDIIWDSRQNAEAVDGLYEAFPVDKLLDANGKDLNAKNTGNMLSISSRLTNTITGPDALGAKVSGYFEWDFTARASNPNGSSNVTDRFRCGYIKLNWTKSEILFGLDWHPLYTKEAFPGVINLNTGVPFNPFNRSPQLTFKYNFVPGLKAIASAIYQSDYANYGPQGQSFMYMRYAIVPDMYLGLQFQPGNLLIGLGADFKTIQPRKETTSLKEKDAKGNFKLFGTSEQISTRAFMGHFKYKIPMLEIKGKAIYGANLTEHLLPGAYAVMKLDSLTGAEKYTAQNNLYLWGNIIYGSKLKVGLLAGYYQNLGFNDNILADRIYGRAQTIENITRIAPTIIYSINKVWLSAEWEITNAAFGTIDAKDKGKVINTHNITNHRFQLSLWFWLQ